MAKENLLRLMPRRLVNVQDVVEVEICPNLDMYKEGFASCVGDRVGDGGQSAQRVLSVTLHWHANLKS